MSNYQKTDLNTEAYEPFMLEDKQAGEVHWLNQTNSNDAPTFSGLWKCEPMEFDYEFPGDETFHVLKGDLNIKLESGEEIQLCQGDVVNFKKGIKSHWRIQSSFQKFFVIHNV